MVSRHTGDGSSFFGNRMTNSSAPKAYGTGRRCREGGCGVLLPRYRSTHWCTRHESGFFFRKHPPLPDTDPAPSLRVAC